MTILAFDTETSGLPSPDGRCWSTARLVQLSWIVVNDAGDVVKQGNHLINDPSYQSNEESLSCHHITEDMRTRYGIDGAVALKEFIADCSKVQLIVCHSGIFDFGVLHNECMLRKVNLRPMFNVATFNTKKSDVYISRSPTNLADCVADADPSFTPPGGLQPHDALFDTFLCMRLFQLTSNPKIQFTVLDLLKYIGQVISGSKQVRVT